MRRYHLYYWPFQILMDFLEWWSESRCQKKRLEETIHRLNEREDRGLPPNEPWEERGSR